MPKQAQTEQQTVETQEPSVADYFASEATEGIDPNPKVPQPYLIPINKYQDEAGLLLSKDHARNCGFLPFWETEWEKHKFDKSTDMVVYHRSPRMLILHATPFYLEHKETSEVLVGSYDWQNYERDPETSNVCRDYMILLLDENNQPLHNKRFLRLKGKGNHGKSFGDALLGFNSKDRKEGDLPQKGFYQQLEEAIEERMHQQGIAFERPKTTFASVPMVDLPWHSLSVFRPIYKPVLCGTAPKQSWASKVVGFEKPTPENAHEFYAKHLGETVKKMLADVPTWNRLAAVKPVQILPPAAENFLIDESALVNITPNADEVPWH